MGLWTREPALSAVLNDEAGHSLVLDAGDGRVRTASSAAASLALALSALDGTAIARQLVAACPTASAPRLVRLRLDARRIVPPSLFLVARGVDDGGSAVYLAIPSGPTALPRLPAPATTAKESRPTPVAEPTLPAADEVAEIDAPHPGDRFLWRSDDRGTLTVVTGPLGCLVGRSVADLGADAASAIEGRRTFRKVPVSLGFRGALILADLSGAPATREGAGFRGFEGFGVVRGLEEVRPAVSSLPDVTAEGPFGKAPLSDEPPPTPLAMELAREMDEPAPVNIADADLPEDIAQPEASLSTAEHDAFREIARALGARYAGDDEARPEVFDTDRIAGSVMPFPSVRAEALAPAPHDEPEADTSGLLDGLPIAALVHRGDTVIAVNSPFLDLTGFADAAALRAAGLDAVFPGGPPNFRSGMTHETAIALADGSSRPVEVTRGICAWQGGPAAILILRSLEEDDPRRALAAERLAREVQAGRALGAEAALDALQAGVVTVDRDGRVKTLNLAAAALFGASAPELVGASFTALFDTGSGTPLAAALAGEGDTPGVVLAQGRAMMLALAPPRADGHRVAVLHRLPDSIASPPTAEPTPRRAPSPLRLDRELREPIDAILALTHTMLEERFGALGDQRYRACLTDIREAGVRILERVSELSDLAAVEAGQIDLHPRPLALNEVVANCVAVLQTEAARSRIVLRTSFSANLAELEADEPSVRRAASLVIEQAIRRSVAGGQVIVSTGAGEAAEVALRVRDGGPAQDPAEAGPLEEDMRLALPRALVQANGGQLRLRGRGVEGTLVEIVLPVRRGAHG